MENLINPKLELEVTEIYGVASKLRIVSRLIKSNKLQEEEMADIKILVDDLSEELLQIGQRLESNQ